MIKRLLIWVLLCVFGGLFAARGQQPVADTVRRDTVLIRRDTMPGRGDTVLRDSALRADSLRKADSLKKVRADTLLGAAAMLRQVDSMNRTPSEPIDSLRLKLEAQMNAARTGQGLGSRAGPPMNSTSTRAGPPPSKRPAVRRPADLSNLHRKYIPVRSGRIPIDSSSLIPGAFFCKDVPDSAYRLDPVNGSLVWVHPPAGMDSVWVIYRTFPFRLNSVAKRLNFDSIENYFLFRPYEKDKDGRSNADFFNFGNITYNGSFGRSITFGNSQDAVVTSNLNLQLSGFLADSIEIVAAITDNNIPIQPDGTTANLNEFDKVLLQFRKKNWALTMGDIDLRQNQLYFLNFYKRLQGASFETTEQLAPGVTNRTLASAAIAKGKFNRNIFQGQEGNQGPYKLQGANGELYFIVLAGTEKVFIDGQLMQRGEDQDYIINYNTGEVTFTPNRLITQDARIQVEFEYADRNYLNVNLYLYNETNINNKLKVKLGLFSNSDSRNSPINQTLTPDQNKFLNKLGDSIQRAFYPVATVDTFAAGKILYKKVDTTYKNAAGALVHDSVYVFSTDATQTLYNLSFSNVGPGYGNYMPDMNGVNGSVFFYAPPVNGVMQGAYEAAQFLVTPKTQQVVTVGLDYALDKHSTMTAELAHSHYDVNTLSTIDKGNDNGNAMKFTFKNIKPLGSAALGLNLTSTAGFEYVNRNFNPIERLRTPEFTRDWGLPLYVPPADERIYNAGLQLSDKKGNMVKYDAARYERSDGFTGLRNMITQRQKWHGWALNSQVSLTTSDSSDGFSGRFFRPSVDLSKTLSGLKGYTIGGGYSLERNENRDKKADTLGATSYAFHTWTAYLKSPEKAPNKWGMSFVTRTNSYPSGRSLAAGDQSRTYSVFADFLKNPHHQFHITASYREMRITDSTLAAHTVDSSTLAQRGDKTLLGRVEYLINEWKGLVRGNVLYEIGSGQQQRLNYTYLQVPAGTGQYAWIDYNKDGIQQLSEFVLAQFPDQAQYIRVYTPTNDYIKANYNTFNYSLSLNPKAAVTKQSGRLMHFLARTMWQSSMQLNQKEQARGLIQYNPFKAPFSDTALITRTLILVNTFSFNRTDPRWGFDVSNTRNGGKTLLTYGYETRQTNEWSLRSRLNMSKSIALTGVFRNGTNQYNNSSTNFDSANYNLKIWSAEPGLTFTRRSNLRVALSCRLTSKLNAEQWGGQRYTAESWNTDFKYNILQSTSIQGKFTMSSIVYSAAGGKTPSTTSAVAYTILEGLQPGKNYLWSMDLIKKLGNNLELSLQYEGRKAGTTGIVHTGRAALRALL